MTVCSKIRVRMDRWTGKVAVVTGASSGMGIEIAEALVRSGVNVIGVARRVQLIKESAVKLKGERATLYPLECDLRKEDDILRVFDWTEKKLGGIDILVNNAGVVVPGRIIDGSTESYRKIMEVNVIAVAIATREAVRSMIKRNVSGHIININSLGGHNAETIPVPVNIYAASKYAITGLCHSLRLELNAANLKIKVTSLSPGAVDTELIRVAGATPQLLERIPILVGKNIADAVLCVLATQPNVEVKELTITGLEPLDVLNPK